MSSELPRSYKIEKEGMEEDCWNLGFHFPLTLRKVAIFILLIYLWDIRKKPVLGHSSEQHMSIKENQKGQIDKNKNHLNQYPDCESELLWHVVIWKSFLSWLAFILTCSVVLGPCWADPENKGVFVKFSILFLATWSSKFPWTPWNFPDSHATSGPLKFTQ